MAIYIALAVIVLFVGLISIRFVEITRPSLDPTAPIEDRLHHAESTMVEMGRWFARVLTAGVAGFSVGIVGIAWAQDQSQEIEDTKASSDLNACANANEFRSFMADFIDPGDPGDPVAFDISTVPGYKEIDPHTRLFIDALIAQANTERREDHEKAIEYRRDFPVRDCAALIRE